MERFGNTLSEQLLRESSDKGEAIFHRGISQNYEASLAIITSPLSGNRAFMGIITEKKAFVGIKTR